MTVLPANFPHTSCPLCEATVDTGKCGMPSYGKVAIAAVVGNEDGAHHVAAELLQALLEVGFSAPPGGVTYWVGEAMGSTALSDFSAVMSSSESSKPAPRLSRSSRAVAGPERSSVLSVCASRKSTGSPVAAILSGGAGQ